MKGCVAGHLELNRGETTVWENTKRAEPVPVFRFAGRDTLRAGPNPEEVFPDDKELPNRWSSRVVIVRGAVGLRLIRKLVTNEEIPQ